MALSSQDGRVVAKIATCGDADDVFVHPRRHRVYVSCGEGVVDVLEPDGPTTGGLHACPPYQERARLPFESECELDASLLRHAGLAETFNHVDVGLPAVSGGRALVHTGRTQPGRW